MLPMLRCLWRGSVLAIVLVAAAPIAASVLDGWHAAGIDNLDGRELAGLRACGAGGEREREAFASFDPGTDAAAARELAAGHCDVALSGAGSNMAERMAAQHPTRTLYRIQAGALHKVADGQVESPWHLLGKRAVPAPPLANARMCGTGAWRDLYRGKVAGVRNVYRIEERLSGVDFGSCDLAVLSREEMAELGARTDAYQRFVLEADNIRPVP